MNKSSKWSEIIKINDKEFEKIIIKKNIDEIENTNKSLYNIKNIDDEFEKIYNSILIDIKFDFEEYIKDQAMPFLDNRFNYNNYNIYDFLKYNSQNYIDITNKVKNENEENINDIENDEEEDLNEIYDLD